MKILVDHADINAIKKMYEYYPVDGVTTNPSILKKRVKIRTTCCSKSENSSARTLTCMLR